MSKELIIIIGIALYFFTVGLIVTVLNWLNNKERKEKFYYGYS